MPRIFLIGPGGVGKTTVGRLLAARLGYEFVDLDEEFCSRVRPIRNYLDQNGYRSYVRRNSYLFHELLGEYGPSSKTIFALSSGFLATDVEPEIIARNRATVSVAGRAVLLMPSRDFATSLAVVLERQFARNMDLDRKSQEETFQARFGEYLRLGDVQIFSSESVDKIATLIPREVMT